MAIDESLINPILDFLNKEYPDSVEHHDKILPENKNREEIRKCLLHCRNEGWVEFKDESTRDNFHYMFIKITGLGKEYLGLQS